MSLDCLIDVDIAHNDGAIESILLRKIRCTYGVLPSKNDLRSISKISDHRNVHVWLVWESVDDQQMVDVISNTVC